MSEYISLHAASYLVDDQCIYLCVGWADIQHAKMVTSDGITDVLALSSQYEEADTRMILQAVYADSQFSHHQKGQILI